MTFPSTLACEDEGRRRVTRESLIQPAGWREGLQRMDERRGGIEHLSGEGHIWLKYMSPVWEVIFIRQPDKPEQHRQRFFVIQQDSVTGVCPALPSQSPLINTGIERMLCSNFSFYFPLFYFFPPFQSPVCLFLIHSLVGVMRGNFLKNSSLKLILIILNWFKFSHLCL